MDPKKALEILIQGVKIANKRGAFEIEESKLIAEAIEAFTVKQDEKGTNTQTNEGGDTGPKEGGDVQETIPCEESGKKGQ